MRTQCQDVLACIERRGFIDPLMALKFYGILRLAARVNDLRNDGYDIVGQTVPFKSRYGRKSKFTRYSRPPLAL